LHINHRHPPLPLRAATLSHLLRTHYAHAACTRLFLAPIEDAGEKPHWRSRDLSQQAPINISRRWRNRRVNRSAPAATLRLAASATRFAFIGAQAARRSIGILKAAVEE